MKILKNKQLLTFIITLQESFIATVPFFILLGIITFLSSAITYFHIDHLDKKILSEFTQNLQAFSSVIPPISIAYFLAKRIKISQIMAVFLSVISFISIVFYENPAFPLNLPLGFTSASIFIPIIATFSLKILYPKLYLHIMIKDGKHYVYRLFNYIFVFFAAYFLTFGIYVIVDYFMDILIEELNPFNINLPALVHIVIRNILVQSFWFLGMHGEHMVNALFGREILFKEIFPNLTIGEFQRIFVSIGGAGAGISLLISLILYTKDKILKKVVYISAPFTVFNMNTILIFIGVVLNRFMFIPFLIVPLINVFVSYFYIKTLNITFKNQYIVWSTPVLVDGYLKTNSFSVPVLQLVLVVLDSLLYTYFIKKFFRNQSFEDKRLTLEKNLEINTELKSKSDIKAFLASQEIIEANIKLSEIIEKLNKNTLLVYYQPKVNIKKNKVENFEALLRYNDNGEIRGPFFLKIVEEAGLAPVIDIWVCKHVKKDLPKFKQINSVVSINLHPDTLESYDAISKILKILKNESKYIMFEIVERSFVNKKATENVKRLRKNGFKISIDDYGIGYSSLETLIKQDIEELKLDKSIIDEIETSKGFLICKYSIGLCKELKISVVAEGVETESQLKILKSLDVDLIQGFIFSPALPLDEAINYAKNFGNQYLKKAV